MSVIELTPDEVRAKINELNLQLAKLLILSGEIQEDAKRKEIEQEISRLKEKR